MFSRLSTTARSLLRRPVLTGTVVVALALGVMMATSAFQVLYGTLVRPLPLPSAERVVILRTDHRERPAGGGVSLPDFEDYRRESRSFEKLAAISVESFVTTGSELPQRIPGARVTADFFAIFGAEPMLGSIPTAEWQLPDSNSAVLSYSFWRDQFGQDENVLGRVLALDHSPFTIIAVMPPGLDFPAAAKVWLPLEVDPDGTDAAMRGARYLTAVGRLHRGLTLAQADEEVRRLALQLSRDFLDSNGEIVASVESLRERLIGDYREGLLGLAGAVLCVLIMVAVNVAGVLAAREAARSEEFRLRRALGAGAADLFGVVLMEAGLLMVVAALVGLLGAGLVLPIFGTIYAEDLPGGAHLGLDGAAWLFGFGVAVCLSVLVTLPGLVQVARSGSPVQHKIASTGAFQGRRSFRAQAALLVAQVAITLALLTTAGLVLRSLLNLNSVALGFQPKDVFTARISLPSLQYPQGEQRAVFFTEVLERMAVIPEMDRVSASTLIPFGGSKMQFLVKGIGGSSAPPDQEPWRAHYSSIAPRYFETLGIPILEGRDFSALDTDGAPPVIIVNTSFVRKFMNHLAVLGTEVELALGGDASRRIVGVVGDIRHASLRLEPEPAVYVPFQQHPWPFMTLVLKTGEEPESLLPQIRHAVAEVDRHQPVDQGVLLEDRIGGSLGRSRFYSSFLASLGLIAWLVAIVGVYGIASLWVRRSLREIGLRLALGAEPAKILKVWIRRILALAALGTLVGTVLAYLMVSTLEGILFGIEPTDPWTLLGVTSVLVTTILIAAFPPAQRAARVNPATILRHD